VNKHRIFRHIKKKGRGVVGFKITYAISYSEVESLIPAHGIGFHPGFFRVMVMVFNATFNNISVIPWWSVLLVGEFCVPGENH
jgi:hypothetical protein